MRTAHLGSCAAASLFCMALRRQRPGSVQRVSSLTPCGPLRLTPLFLSKKTLSNRGFNGLTLTSVVVCRCPPWKGLCHPQ